MKVKKYTLKSTKVSKDYDLAVVSDFHFSEKTNARKAHNVITALQSIKPTYIVVPGDLYNPDQNTLWNESNSFGPIIGEMTSIAPVYYVKGNTEQEKDILPYWMYQKRYPGFHVLGESKKNGFSGNFVKEDGISFSALKLPLEFYSLSEEAKRDYIVEKYSFYLEEISHLNGYSTFSVFLCHDPSVALAIEEALRYQFNIYFDLIITGRIHGFVPKNRKDEVKRQNKKYKGLIDVGEYGSKMLASEGITEYSSSDIISQRLDHFHKGTIENVLVRKRKF